MLESALGSQSVLGLEWVLALGSQLESRLLLELGSGSGLVRG